MQIYEPYANEGIPRLIAHKMEAFAGTSPSLPCPGSFSVLTGVSHSAILTQFPEQQPSRPLASTSSTHFLLVILQCPMDSTSLICKRWVCLVAQETTESRGGTLHLAYFPLKSLGSHSTSSLSPPWGRETNPGQPGSPLKHTHPQDSFRKGQRCVRSSCRQESQCTRRPILALN